MPWYFFCLIIGLLIGALLTWFLLADHPFESREAPGGPVDQLESGVLASQLKEAGIQVEEATITRVLELHGAYVVGRLEDEPAGVDKTPDPDVASANDQAVEPPTA